MSAQVLIRGRATHYSDPLFTWDAPRTANVALGAPIMKRLPVSELPATVSRWLAMGRKITSIEEWR